MEIHCNILSTSFVWIKHLNTYTCTHKLCTDIYFKPCGNWNSFITFEFIVSLYNEIKYREKYIVLHVKIEITLGDSDANGHKGLPKGHGYLLCDGSLNWAYTFWALLWMCFTSIEKLF